MVVDNRKLVWTVCISDPLWLKCADLRSDIMV